MKKLSFLGLLLILILILTGCGNNESNESKETSDKNTKKQGKSQVEEPFKELNIGQSKDFSFGSFSINGFKRDDNKLYYSVSIEPLDRVDKEIELSGLKYYTGKTSHKINKETINLTAEPFQGLYSIDTDKVADVDAISLEYNGIKAKWLLDKNANSSGDVDFIDSEISKPQEDQNQNNQQSQVSQPQTQVQQHSTQIYDNAVQEETQNQINIQAEERTINQAWQLIEQYGKQFYPEGFIVNYASDKQVEERYSDGVWNLQAGCNVTNENGEVINGTCRAEVERIDGHWEILSFEVY